MRNEIVTQTQDFQKELSIIQDTLDKEREAKVILFKKIEDKQKSAQKFENRMSDLQVENNLWNQKTETMFN